MVKKFIIIVLCLLLIGCSSDQGDIEFDSELDGKDEKIIKLHWFIPDGMRADPNVFTVFKWAEEGKLPNIKRLMERGSYGYSIPTFPTHTPTNFATLLTGTYPKAHGVADGPMHIEGFPLLKPSVGGFSSTAKKVLPIWSILENGYGYDNTVLLSVPGSTPPELKKNGITIRGRWGGWGADFHSLIFEKKSIEQRKKLARGSRLFFLGYELTKFIDYAGGGEAWGDVSSFSEPKDLVLEVHGATIYALIIDTTDDGSENYDSIVFSRDRVEEDGVLGQGGWSDWIPVHFDWKGEKIESFLKMHVVKLEDDGFFRIRAVVNNLNSFIVDPASVSDELIDEVGPMIDFVDNFPPQLIYYDEDKQTFLDEAGFSFDWHRDAVSAVYDLYDPSVFIHDIYSPNQMLTTRWWMGYVDPSSKRYNDVSEKEREELWNEVMDMYKDLDGIVGEALKEADDDTIIVLSSDHGATPLDKWVRLNNLFADRGWLVFEIDPETGEPKIDMEKTKVIYLKMDSIYINPEGIGEIWNRASGKEYEALREEVRSVLTELRDGENIPVAEVVRWENVEEFLDLPTDRVGDLVIANTPGYGWNEEITGDGEVFDVPLKTGYKQAIFAKEVSAMWTPFIIAGPGVKKNHFVKNPINHVDQFPTIMRLMGHSVPHHVEGMVIGEVFE